MCGTLGIETRGGGGVSSRQLDSGEAMHFTRLLALVAHSVSSGKLHAAPAKKAISSAKRSFERRLDDEGPNRVAAGSMFNSESEPITATMRANGSPRGALPRIKPATISRSMARF